MAPKRTSNRDIINNSIRINLTLTTYSVCSSEEGELTCSLVVDLVCVGIKTVGELSNINSSNNQVPLKTQPSKCFSRCYLSS